MPKELEPAAGPLRRRLFEIVFHAEDRTARLFDVVLMVAIVLSVVVVMLDSVEIYRDRYREAFQIAEWVFTIVFSIEYGVRLWVVKRPVRYAFSFFGLVDFLSVIPTYITFIVPGAHALLSVRILRVLRIFRVLKLANYLSEANTLGRALAASRRKIFVFIFVVLTLVTVMGSLMYMIEGGENGFTSIPKSIYWAVVTVTTVGYGDISPATPAGQGLALVLMVMGYGIIAVPTGIVTVELNREVNARAEEAGRLRALRQLAECPTCGLDEHDPDARHCKWCGERILAPPSTPT